jgi:hypothetical protein
MKIKIYSPHTRAIFFFFISKLQNLILEYSPNPLLPSDPGSKIPNFSLNSKCNILGIKYTILVYRITYPSPPLPTLPYHTQPCLDVISLVDHVLINCMFFVFFHLLAIFDSTIILEFTVRTSTRTFLFRSIFLYHFPFSFLYFCFFFVLH